MRQNQERSGKHVNSETKLTFVWAGSGLWHPEAGSLALLRQEIDRNGDQLKNILSNSGIRKEIFDNVPKDEKRIVKAFVSQNQENALKTKPKVRDCPPCTLWNSASRVQYFPFLHRIFFAVNVPGHRVIRIKRDACG